MNEIPTLKKKEMEFMGKTFSLLFIVQIIIAILSVLKSSFFAELSPIFGFAIRVIALITVVFYYIYLTLIKDQNPRYATAGTFGMISIGTDFIIGFIPLSNAFVIFLASLVVIAFSGIAEYNEYLSHAEYFSDINDDLKSKWENLCSIYLVTLCITIACALLITLMPRIATAGTIISLVVLLIIRILKLVYLHDSGAYIKNYGKPL